MDFSTNKKMISENLIKVPGVPQAVTIKPIHRPQKSLGVHPGRS